MSNEGFQPVSTPTTPGFYPPAGSQWASTDDQSSTADVAKDQAASVAGNAKDAAKDVADTAKEQVAHVSTEAKKQVKDLVGQARTELTEQAQVQQQRVAGGLHSVGDQLKAMAQGSDDQGPLTDLAHQAADKAHSIAEFFDNRDPGSVLDEVRSFARKQPGVFLALSLGAGVLAGRLARGLSAEPESSAAATTTGPGNGVPGLGAGVPTPALYSGTPAPALYSGGTASDFGVSR